MPARMPASGPSRRPSRCGGALDVGWIGDHRHLERARMPGIGSLATTTRSMTCGRSRSTTCATIGLPPSSAQRLRHARAHAPALAARQHDADQRAGPDRPEMHRFALTTMAALCEAPRTNKGEEPMAFSIAKVANWLPRSTRRAPSSAGGRRSSRPTTSGSPTRSRTRS